MPAPYDQQWIASSPSGFRSRSSLHPLCTSCGKQATCSIRGPKIMHCHLYMPVLSFKSDKGLDGRWNTFRKGTAWARRVTLDGDVGLYSLAEKRIIGKGLVTAAHQGVLGELLSEHAHMNHLIKSYPAHEAPERLQRVLRNIYGSNYSQPTESYSVIYIETR